MNGQGAGFVERAMAFVDGTNFLISMFEVLGVNLSAERASDDAYTLAGQSINRHTNSLAAPQRPVRRRVIRSYWFGAIQGSPEVIEQRKILLRRLGFEAMLFQKIKGKGEKGVDLAVAREMLVHGFNGNYEAAILLAGDEDYVGLIQDVKRLGVSTIGTFFEGASLAPRLRVEFDEFLPFEFPLPSDKSLIEALQAASKAQ